MGFIRERKLKNGNTRFQAEIRLKGVSKAVTAVFDRKTDAKARCRLHGGKSTGPRTEKGRKRMKEANTKHGLYSAEMIQARRHARDLIRESRETNRGV